MIKEALFYENINDYIRCRLCAHNCKITANQRGICNVRENIDNHLLSLNYMRIVAENIDPIEKKPLYHFLPSTFTYSIAAAGCNFSCKNCQNYSISQVSQIFGTPLTASDIVKRTLDNHLLSISYTYTEPTIYYETAREIGILAKESGVKNIFVSNGFMGEIVIDDLCCWLDAANIDLKSFNDDFYKKICNGRLKPVLENIVRLKERGIWVEITTLLIPELNDSEKEIRSIAKFIKSVDEDMPWHISAFYPTYNMSLALPTPPEKVEEARSIALSEGLKFVYSGNIRSKQSSNTYCPNCMSLVIQRVGYSVTLNIKGDRCSNCGKILPGVFIN